MMAFRRCYNATVFIIVCFSCIYAGSLGVAAQQGQSSTIDILAQQGCDVGTALVPNMQDCVLDELMGNNGTLVFTFTVGPRPRHSILLTLRSTGGGAAMRLYNSGDSFYDSQMVYFNDAVTETYIRLPADQVIAGQYTLVVQGTGGPSNKMLVYLRLQTPAANVRLAAEDKAAMQDLLEECCPPAARNNPASSFCTQFMPNALAAKTAEEDLCNIGDFVCDEDGHLEKIDFSNAGLDCKSGFPAAFGQLPELETLILGFNNFNGDTLDNVAAVLADNGELRRLMIRYANLTGTVPCSLVEEHQLRTLMFSGNKLEGTLPGCILEAPDLEELYMSFTTLSGPLPDSFNTDSNLRVWYALNADPSTGELAGPGFTGEIPTSISNAANLQYVQLSDHRLTGGVPALPSSMVMFEVHGNDLDGGIASPLPGSLVFMDCRNNSLTGPVPDFSESPELSFLDLSMNQLTGSIPSTFGAAAQSLMYVDLSTNLLAGNINDGNQWEELPQIQYLLLQENNLEGFVPASLAANKNLVVLHLGTNLLEGDLEAFASAITPAEAQSRQQSSARGRKLKSTTGSRDLSMLVARKLFGGYEDKSTPQPQNWQHDVQYIKALATGDVQGARRRLQQAVAAAPAAAALPATTAALPAATATVPATAATPVVQEQPAAGGATTTTMAEQEPAEVEVPAEDPAAAAEQLPEDVSDPAGDEVPPDNPQLPPTTQTTPQQTQAQVSSQQNDIGLVPLPTHSALQGNSFLYLNLSNNAISGGIPDGLGNLEMFRNPLNSTDIYDQYVSNRGGPDRILDLEFNELYGEFPLFLIKAGNLQDGCSCNTEFNVTEGNFLYCPTKATLDGVELSRDEMNAVRAAGFTCLVPAAGEDKTVLLHDYLSQPANWLTSIPAASEVVTEKTLSARTPINVDVRSINPAAAGRSSGSSLGGGAIAGIVIGVLAGVAILASLAYFVGYKKFYQAHRATSFKRGQIPDGPAVGIGEYPAAALGPQPAGPMPRFDIETPTSPAPR